MCRIAPESVHLNRRESVCRESGVNIFFNFCPALFRAAGRAKKSCAQSHLRGDVARVTQRLLLLQGVDVVVEADFGGGLTDEMPVRNCSSSPRIAPRLSPCVVARFAVTCFPPQRR
jgi:hypothetical protein